jgi:hypothetical protein
MVLPQEGAQKNMGKRVVYFSDLTNQTFEDGRELERIVVVWHPDLQNGPVELEVAEDEIESIRSGALRVVSLKLPQVNGSAPETVTIEIETFNRLAGGRDMAAILRQAEPANTPRKQTKPGPAHALTKSATASATPMLATASAIPKLADESTKEGCGIWPWLAGLGLALVVLGVLAWTGLLSSLGAP